VKLPLFPSPNRFSAVVDEEKMNGPARFRRTRDGWRNTSSAGTPPSVFNLSSALTKTASYRMTAFITATESARADASAARAAAFHGNLADRCTGRADTRN